MSEQKRYTAQEMREAILKIKSFQGNRQTAIHIEDMLRQAAEMQERCENVIARCNEAKDMNSPTWNFDKQAFALDLYEVVNYILRGDAGKEEK